MKTNKIIYWVTTTLIFLFEGVMPALTFNSKLAKDGISHLGYPDYFRIWLTVFKVIGALLLILPMFKGRIKEWVYAGFAFDFIFAAISHAAVDGFGGDSIFALVVLLVLVVSYVCYHKIQGAKN
ncbi:DoxX family protein [Chitinophagaceae bacterium LWZ2-11]